MMEYLQERFAPQPPFGWLCLVLLLLIPLVWLFGLAGLVGAQVSMNGLVFVLIVWIWPAEFGLRSGPAGRRFWSGLGRVVAASALAMLLVREALDLFGDPLSWGLGGRLAVCAGMSVALLLTYAGLGTVLKVPVVPEMRVALRTLRRRGMDPAAPG